MSDRERTGFEQIEQRAQAYLEHGFEPTDSEPGEWLELTHRATGQVIVIEAEEG